MDNIIYTSAEVTKTEKGYIAVASTSVMDRQNESVSITGWELKNFKKNPVLLWAHNHDIPAIGTAKNIKIEGVGKKAQLVFEPIFHDYTPEAQAIKEMFDERILNSFSVGFKPLDTDGNEYTKQELLEISAVNVPANPEARIIAYKTLTKAGFSKDTIKSVGIEIEGTDLIEELRTEVKELNNKYNEVVKELKTFNPQGRNADVRQKLSLLKVVARANDTILQKDTSTAKKAQLAKIAKRATEMLIVEHKKELKK
jgi:HK97 family phage prohead protease